MKTWVKGALIGLFVGLGILIVSVGTLVIGWGADALKGTIGMFILYPLGLCYGKYCMAPPYTVIALVFLVILSLCAVIGALIAKYLEAHSN